jgi:hypothetical protein
MLFSGVEAGGEGEADDSPAVEDDEDMLALLLSKDKFKSRQ